MSKITLDTECLQTNHFRNNTSKLVLFCLLRDVGEDGIVYTSASNIAKEIGVCEKTIRNVLSYFSKCGIIENRNPILSPNKIRYLGRCVKLNIIDDYSGEKKDKVRKKSENKSDIATNKTSSNALSNCAANEPVKKFIKPTLEEVQSYIRVMNYLVDAQSFIDYYESNGWMVGKSKMKDWKATIRRWNRNQYGTRQSNCATTKYTAEREANSKRVGDGLRAAMDVVARENGF